MESLKKFCKDESGLEMVEYAMLAALIVIGVALAMPGIQASIVAAYQRIIDELAAAGTPATGTGGT